MPTQTLGQIFEKYNPSVMPLLKKKQACKAGHAGIIHHSVSFINKEKRIKKEWTDFCFSFNIM